MKYHTGLYWTIKRLYKAKQRYLWISVSDWVSHSFRLQVCEITIFWAAYTANINTYTHHVSFWFCFVWDWNTCHKIFYPWCLDNGTFMKQIKLSKLHLCEVIIFPKILKLFCSFFNCFTTSTIKHTVLMVKLIMRMW